MIEQFYLLTTVVLGLFAGSLLTEACILVPYWRRMKPAEFFDLHSSLGPNLFRYFAPLTTLAVGMAVATTIVDGFNNVAWGISAGLSVITLAIFFFYFRAANNSFAEHDLANSELENELSRWSKWHWFRTALMIIALAASVYGHSVDGLSTKV